MVLSALISTQWHIDKICTKNMQETKLLRPDTGIRTDLFGSRYFKDTVTEFGRGKSGMFFKC